MAEEEGDDGGGAWLISYADLMTLLFAAFVVLYGITPQGEDKSQLGVLAVIRESFVEIPEYLSKLDEQTRQESKPGLYSFRAYLGETNRNQVRKTKDTDDIAAIIARDQRRVDELLNKFAVKRLKVDLSMRNALTTKLGERGFSINLVGAYFFAPGSSRLSPEGRKRLLRLGKLLKPIDAKLFIEGHTDNRSNENHAEIAALRAAHVTEVLTVENRIGIERIEMISYGKTQPIGDNRTKEGRSANRRIEIKLEY